LHAWPRELLKRTEWLFPVKGRWLGYLVAGLLVAAACALAWRIWLGPLVRVVQELERDTPPVTASPASTGRDGEAR
jgi:hypothetical protein